MRISRYFFLLLLLQFLYSAPSMAQQVVCPGEPPSCAADTVIVPILIEEPNGLDVFGLDLLLSNPQIEYLYTIPSGITADWFALDGSNPSPGLVRIGGFHTTPISVSDPDTLCYVALRPGGANVEITLTNFIDDLNGTPDCVRSVCLVPVETTNWGRIKRLWRGH